MFHPCSNDGDEEVDANEHVEIPEWCGVVVKVKDEEIEFVEGRCPSVVGRDDVGVDGFHPCGKVTKVEEGEKD